MKVNILSIIIKQVSSTTVKERTKNITAKKKNQEAYCFSEKHQQTRVSWITLKENPTIRLTSPEGRQHGTENSQSQQLTFSLSGVTGIT